MALHQTARDALPIRLGNRKYNIDLARLARATVDPIRQGFDTQGTSGEQSLNQAGVWKRFREDWELGGGQREADTPESNLRRFHASTGINPWVKNELTLHKATASVMSSSSSNLNMVAATSGGTERVYCVDGSDVQYSSNGTTWAAITNPAAGAIDAIATDGRYVYVSSAAGSGEIQRIDGTAVSGSTVNTDYWVVDDVDGLWVANGYLLASIGSRLTVVSRGSSVGSSGDITDADFTQVGAWTSVVGSPSGIYAGGNLGDVGRIYRVGITDSTGALSAPVIASEFPHGETINTLAEYAGLFCIGTTKGFRLAQQTSTGYLTYGPRVDIDGGINQFEPQGEFIWFTWSDYKLSSDYVSGTASTHKTGLGRISLAELIDTFVPAYASDLMATGQSADVTGVATLGGKRLFAITGVGVYQEQSTYVDSGEIDEGRFRWGTTELKTAVSIDMRHSKLATNESISIKLTDDTGNHATIVSNVVDAYSPGIKSLIIPFQQDSSIYGLATTDLVYVSATTSVVGEYISPLLTLNGPGTSTPTLYRWTTRAIPMPYVAEIIQLPIILTTQTRYERKDIYQNVHDDYTYLRSLLENRSLVTFELGDESKTVHVAGVSYEQGAVSNWSDSENWFEGILTVSIVTVQGT